MMQARHFHRGRIAPIRKRSDHGDPGRSFPWDRWLALIADLLDGDDGDDEVVVPVFTVTLKGGSVGDAVRVWQRRMRIRGWNVKVDGTFVKDLLAAAELGASASAAPLFPPQMRE